MQKKTFVNWINSYLSKVRQGKKYLRARDLCDETDSHMANRHIAHLILIGGQVRDNDNDLSEARVVFISPLALEVM